MTRKKKETELSAFACHGNKGKNISAVTQYFLVAKTVNIDDLREKGHLVVMSR